MYEERDGILDRLDIMRNLPREHNPRGSRLERFHLELAIGRAPYPAGAERDRNKNA